MPTYPPYITVPDGYWDIIRGYTPWIDSFYWWVETDDKRLEWIADPAACIAGWYDEELRDVFGYYHIYFPQGTRYEAFPNGDFVTLTTEAPDTEEWAMWANPHYLWPNNDYVPALSLADEDDLGWRNNPIFLDASWFPGSPDWPIPELRDPHWSYQYIVGTNQPRVDLELWRPTQYDDAAALGPMTTAVGLMTLAALAGGLTWGRKKP